jgi:hypothetical protein
LRNRWHKAYPALRQRFLPSIFCLTNGGEHWTLLKSVGALASLNLSEFIDAGQVRVGSVCGLALRFQAQTRAALLRCGTRSVRRDGLELRLHVEEDDETVFHVADQEDTVEHEHKREHEVLHGH